MITIDNQGQLQIVHGRKKSGFHLMFPLEFQPGTERRKYEQKGIFSTPSKKLHAGSGPKNTQDNIENQNKDKKEIILNVSETNVMPASIGAPV